jgi:hypothetical protein
MDFVKLPIWYFHGLFVAVSLPVVDHVIGTTVSLFQCAVLLALLLNVL